DPGVGAKDVDLADRRARSLDQRGNAFFRSDVARERGPVDLFGDFGGRVAVEVRGDHASARRGEAPGQRRADPAASAGDDDTGTFKRGHRAPARVRPPSRTTVCPVLHPASSESRNATAPPMSDGTPRRSSGSAAATSPSRPPYSAGANCCFTMAA